MRRYPLVFAALALLGVRPPILAEGHAFIDLYSIKDAVPVKTWKSLRDERIVKQDLDFSCGAASLATILSEFYGQSIIEEALLRTMDTGDLRASFEDMAEVLPRFGFRGAGFAASFEQLTKLKIPVLDYLKHRKDDHFSVLRGIDADTVWLADPSLGNRTYSRAQFLDMWETRRNADLKGKFLAVLPPKGEALPTGDFFTPRPRRQTALAIQEQAVRNLP